MCGDHREDPASHLVAQEGLPEGSGGRAGCGDSWGGTLRGSPFEACRKAWPGGCMKSPPMATQRTGAGVQVQGHRDRAAQVQVHRHRFRGTIVGAQAQVHKFRCRGAGVRVQGHRYSAQAQVHRCRVRGAGAQVQVPRSRCRGAGAQARSKASQVELRHLMPSGRWIS